MLLLKDKRRNLQFLWAFTFALVMSGLRVQERWQAAQNLQTRRCYIGRCRSSAHRGRKQAYMAIGSVLCKRKASQMGLRVKGPMGQIPMTFPDLYTTLNALLKCEHAP